MRRRHFSSCPPYTRVIVDRLINTVQTQSGELNDPHQIYRRLGYRRGGLAGSRRIAQSGPAPKPEFSFEKCYGVSKAGMNDCQTNTHSCAGTASADNQGDAWVYVPVGSCGKLTGGSTEPKA
jgi:uncharacterized membrane protein